ncbi:unnamed protein product [Polarella glacialis]|uniref:Uncharacterized protein n=1 Tax=Polarella glacialis TaxID=89957 RepID=A0A813EGZ3_POLGL|nr:unnamed protein product [Polarella glacialis]
MHGEWKQDNSDQQQPTSGLEVGEDRQQPTKPHQQQRRKKQHKNKNTTQRRDQQVNGNNRFFNTQLSRKQHQQSQEQVSKYGFLKNLNIMKKDRNGREPMQR